MDSPAGHELALTIINDGAGYRTRCELARSAVRPLISSFAALSQQIAAQQWLSLTLAGARDYERQFGSPDASCFTAADILAAAAELAEYYDAHVKETG